MVHNCYEHDGKELERNTGGKLNPLLSPLRASWQLSVHNDTRTSRDTLHELARRSVSCVSH